MKISPEIAIAEFDVPGLVHELTPAVAPGPAPASAPGTSVDRVGPRSYRLSELSPYELDVLCKRFTTAVFKKAGKLQPPRDVPAEPRQRLEKEPKEPEEYLPE